MRENVRSTCPRAAELEFYLRGSVGVHAELRTASLVRHGAMAASASGRLIRRITIVIIWWRAYIMAPGLLSNHRLLRSISWISHRTLLIA